VGKPLRFCASSKRLRAGKEERKGGSPTYLNTYRKKTDQKEGQPRGPIQEKSDKNLRRPRAASRSLRVHDCGCGERGARGGAVNRRCKEVTAELEKEKRKVIPLFFARKSSVGFSSQSQGRKENEQAIQSVWKRSQRLGEERGKPTEAPQPQQTRGNPPYVAIQHRESRRASRREGG